MKTVIKAGLRQLGLVAVRADTKPGVYASNPPRSMLDYLLLQVFPSLHNLSFIQVGANDGELEDPLARYLESYSWSGLMVEPLPQHFEKLKKKYAHNPRIQLLNAAVAGDEAGRQIFEIRGGPADLPDYHRGLGTFDKARILDAARRLNLDEQAIIATEVKTVSWARVESLFGARSCDLLAIDTEGFDYEIIKMIDLGKFLPKIIHFEHSLLSPEDRFKCYETLCRHGYEIATFYGDTTAWQRGN